MYPEQQWTTTYSIEYGFGQYYNIRVEKIAYYSNRKF